MEKGEKMEKFCVGPTISKPGPMLFNVAATAVKFVVKLKLSMPSIGKKVKLQISFNNLHNRKDIGKE